MTLSDRNLPVTGAQPAAKMQPVALDNSIFKQPGTPQNFLDVLNDARVASIGRPEYKDYTNTPGPVPGTATPPPDWATPDGKAALAAKHGGMKFDGGKPRWSLLMKGIHKGLRGVLTILEFGALKYAADSWKQVPPAKYEEALMRHLAEINEHGLQHVDYESGYLSIYHLACDALFLCHFATVEAERQAREATR